MSISQKILFDKEAIDDLCSSDLSKVSEMSKMQRKWKMCENQMNEMKKEWLLKIYSEFYKHCVPKAVSTRAT